MHRNEQRIVPFYFFPHTTQISICTFHHFRTLVQTLQYSSISSLCSKVLRWILLPLNTKEICVVSVRGQCRKEKVKDIGNSHSVDLFCSFKKQNLKVKMLEQQGFCTSEQIQPYHCISCIVQ